jgi:hypothetical protein
MRVWVACARSRNVVSAFHPNLPSMLQRSLPTSVQVRWRCVSSASACTKVVVYSADSVTVQASSRSRPEVPSRARDHVALLTGLRCVVAIFSTLPLCPCFLPIDLNTKAQQGTGLVAYKLCSVPHSRTLYCCCPVHQAWYPLLIRRVSQRDHC